MKVIVVYKQEKRSVLLLEIIQNILRYKNIEVEFLETTKNNSNNVVNFLYNISADIIVSIDMEGFQFKTLQENSFYNILSAKQLHFLTDESKLQEYMGEDFALNLYMAVPKNEYKNAVLEGTNNIPHIIYHPCYEVEKDTIISSPVNLKIVEEIIGLFIENSGDEISCF